MPGDPAALRPRRSFQKPESLETATNARIAFLAVALIATAPAYADGSDQAGKPGRTDMLAELADYTGLSERKVQMILGCRTCVAEYVYTYQRSLEKFRSALGDERYERLMQGRPILLEHRRDDRVTSIDNQGAPTVP